MKKPATLTASKQCPICHSAFKPSKPWQKFCSLKCHGRARRRIKATLALRAERPAKVKADYNVRFATRGDYVLIKTAAAMAEESMNLFITSAAVRRATSTIRQASPRTPSPVVPAPSSTAQAS